MLAIVALVAGLLLAYANGANDNFKGVATLYGSGTASYRLALLWATMTTAGGSLMSVWLAHQLLARFSGKGIVPADLAAQASFGVAVALGAGLTVLLASRFGFPVSTTHALVGSILGASVASAGNVNWYGLSTTMLAPLMVSPIIAIGATGLVYLCFHRARLTLGVEKETCLCAGQEVVEVISAMSQGSLAMVRAKELSVSTGNTVSCRDRYAGSFVGIEARQTLDILHFVSAGMVSFARGLNDTPKIAALLLLFPAFTSSTAVIACGIAIALGGLLNGKRIAEMLSHRITPMNPGQGFSANLVTSVLVIGASRWGMPVSTTHVSCGALFGIGTVNGQIRWQAVGQILLAWIITLPLGAALATGSLLCIRWMSLA